MELSDKKKDFICDCIIMFAKFEFKIEFMQWYLRNKINTTSPRAKDKSDDMNHSIKLARTMA